VKWSSLYLRFKLIFTPSLDCYRSKPREQTKSSTGGSSDSDLRPQHRASSFP